MFKKPNVKSVTSAGVTALAIVAGAKIGDGIVAVMPDSTASFKKILVGGIALIAAASVDAKTQTAQAAQSALIGIGVKQICDEVTEQLTKAVPAQGKVDAVTNVTTATTVTEKFINGVVGHGLGVASLGSSWDASSWDQAPTQMWDRPLIEEPVSVVEFNADLLV